jgi:hypothetical protein
MEMLVFILYCVLSYWAVGQTIYANKIQIGSLKDIFLTRFVLGVLLGLILIPVAILKKLFIHWNGRKNTKELFEIYDGSAEAMRKRTMKQSRMSMK